MQNIILTHKEIEHKIKRISYQIFETFVDDKEVIIAGISKSGFILAKKIATELETISDLKVLLCEVHINKQNPQETITTSISSETYKNKALILVDDVLSSGTTLIYGVKHFLEVPLSKFKTAVLVDRNHKKYPVKADFKGLSLSTSLQEHIQVIFEENNSYAYLS
ncbi:phosphoribosyltransferase [Flavobacterium jejuense]|uniref:Phosphoribosyltransferase n=1 Tax=Flavobacterium jejuense TaxID=1544455 RepID=A0ABX0IV16_9FLAO|nr:phosphoribosyltransferase family protein [Flavobacterium jejuense]NHN27755.1 phosphoribosyltransferase [Flavobacterium jejuense]